MQHHEICGWDIYHESKPSAPPILSARILVPQSTCHQREGFPSVYINLLRQILYKEGVKYSIAGTPFVSWGLHHITIGIHTLEEDLEDFLLLVQKVLRCIPTQEMIEEELLQQKSLDKWNATQPRELMYATLYERYFGRNHSLRHDIDGTWKERASIDRDRFSLAVEQSWPASLIIVSRMPWAQVQLICTSALKTTYKIPTCTYQTPAPVWGTYSIPCVESEQVGCTLVRPARTIGDPLEYATDLALMCIAGMFHSRMNQKIRLDDGMSYGVDAQYIRTSQWARVEISCFVQADRIQQAWAHMHDVLDHAASNWTLEELEKTRTILLRNEQLREETCAQTCAIRAYQLQTRGTLTSIEESCLMWNDVSINDIETAMKELVQARELALCIGTAQAMDILQFTQAPIPNKYIFE